MQRRSFIAGLVATAAGLLVPARLLEDDPKRVYSFVRKPRVPTLRFMAGAQPLATDTDLSDELMLADLKFNGHGFRDFSANRTGTASWARYTDALGRSFNMPISVSAAHGGIVLNTTSIYAGAVVTCSSITISEIA